MTIAETLLTTAKNKKLELEKTSEDEKYWADQVDEKLKTIRKWLQPLEKDYIEMSGTPYTDEKDMSIKEFGLIKIRLLDKKNIDIIDQGIDLLGGFGRIDFKFDSDITMLILLAKDGEWILRSRYEEDERKFTQENFEEVIKEFIETL